MSQSSYFGKSEVPPDHTAPDGMKMVFADKSDRYPAEYLPNIEYARYGDRALHLQVLQPRAAGPFPLLVYVQGSAWRPQNLYAALPQLADFAHRGFVVASVEYRSTLEGIFPTQAQDAKTAIRFLRANAAQFKIDPARVAVWGDSSGGHTAVMVGVSEGLAEFETSLYPGESSGVRAVVDFYGPTDLLQMNSYPSIMDHNDPNSPESLLMGGQLQENPEKAAQANPIIYISKEKTLPPFLILHGDLDPLVPFNQSVLLYEALKAAGQNATFYKVKGAGHGDRFWTPEVLDLVYKFLLAYV